MPGATFLEGESVVLATIEEADLAFVHEWVNHPSVRRSIGQWHPTTRAQERRWWEADAEDGDSIRLLVTVDGERAGAVELEDVVDVLKAYETVWGHRMKGFQLQRNRGRGNRYLRVLRPGQF